jgi:hypothetical protein
LWERPRRLLFCAAPLLSKEADLQFVFLRRGDGLELAMTYNTENFSLGRAQGVLGGLGVVVQAMVAERPMADVMAKAELWR